MSDLVVFNKSIIGAGHIIKKKPCQDYSICENNDGIQVLVVCDGHGGSSYVRSHTGAKIAANATMRILKNFAMNNKDNVFANIEMAVTAKPQRNPFIDIDGNKLRYQDLDETQQEIARQAQDYICATEHHQKQQYIVNKIIYEIIATWKNEIESDARAHKFTKEERTVADRDLAKAYGCTVLAYLRTPQYWLAIQIGDGKIVCCDEKMVWTEPVPHDCECFLNRTTSLCDKSPDKEFRYAFSGKGDFPIAVFLNSDGVDGSFGNKDNLQEFYAEVIELFQDSSTDIQRELEEFLPKLSEQGNHDDMSIAGMVDISWLKSNARLLGIIKEERDMRAEREAMLSSISQLESSLETIDTKLDKIKEISEIQESDFNSWLQDISEMREKKETELRSLHEKENKLSAEKDTISTELKRKQKELDEWQVCAKNTMAELEGRKKELMSKKGESVSKGIANMTYEANDQKPNPEMNLNTRDPLWDESI